VPGASPRRPLADVADRAAGKFGVDFRLAAVDRLGLLFL